MCIKEQSGKVYTVGEKLQNTRLAGLLNERTIDLKISREDMEHGQEFTMQRPHTCEFLHSAKSPYLPQFYSLLYKMNEVKTFLAHLLKRLAS